MTSSERTKHAKPYPMKRRNLRYYFAVLISLVTFAVYLADLQNAFVGWDDNDYVYENPYIRSFDFAFFRWAFFHFYAGNWHPLTWISHALDYALWGLNPLGHHLTSNTLHAVNTFLVVLLVVKLLEASRKLIDARMSPNCSSESGGTLLTSPMDKGGGEGSSDRRTLIAAATTGLLFGLHPLHVESVAWVAERKDLLCGLFFLLSIMMYVRCVTQAVSPLSQGRGEVGGYPPTTTIPPLAPSYPKRGWRSLGSYLLSLGFFMLALLSKPMAVSLPLVLFILDWYPFGRITSLKTFRGSLIEKLPFIALSIASSVLTFLAQKTAGAIRSWEVYPLSSRTVVAVKSLVAYMGKMLAPLNLMPLYTYPRDVSLSSADYLLPIVLTAGITLACIIAAKRRRLWIAAWGYYVVSLIPVLGIVQVGGQSMADRYTYLPSLGPFFVAGLVVAWYWEKLNALRKWGPAIKHASAAAAILVCVFSAYLTVKQIRIWENDMALWDYVIEKEPEKVSIAYYMRGQLFQRQGENDKALADYNMVNALEPFHAELHLSRGSLLETMGQPDKAMEDYSMAIAIYPRAEEALISRGILYGKSGLFDKAIGDFNKVIEINSKSPLAYVNRGCAYASIGQNGKALADFSKTIEIDHDFAGAYINRGSLYLKSGNEELALPDFKKACDLRNGTGCETWQAIIARRGRGKPRSDEKTRP